MYYVDDATQVVTMLAAEKKIFVGTTGGTVAVLDSETKTFLTAYSWHEGKVDALLDLPEEVKPCICSEIPFVSPDQESDCRRHSQIYVPTTDNIHCIPNLEPDAVMIASIGKGKINYNGDNSQSLSCEANYDINRSDTYLLIWKS